MNMGCADGQMDSGLATGMDNLSWIGWTTWPNNRGKVRWPMANDPPFNRTLTKGPVAHWQWTSSKVTPIKTEL